MPDSARGGPGAIHVAALHDALTCIRKTLDAKGLRYCLEAKQLYHDREEVTVFLARKR